MFVFRVKDRYEIGIVFCYVFEICSRKDNVSVKLKKKNELTKLKALISPKPVTRLREAVVLLRF